MVIGRAESERLLEMKFVVDTSVFTNPDTYKPFGESPDAAAAAFFRHAAKTPHEMYMPRTIKRELDHFVSPKTADFVDHHCVVRSPSRHELFIPASLFYEFVEEMRVRIDRGLRVAEKAARTMSKEDVRALREQYRDSLRHGIIDSKEDMDIILLAREIGGNVISADEGVRKWADKLGLRVMDPTRLKAIFGTGSDWNPNPKNQS